MRTTIVAWIAVIVLLACSCAAEPRGAGYDPERDPAADLAAALEEATESGKRVLLEVGGEWCSWCHMLEEFFRTHDHHRALLHDRYVVVKVNFSPENENAGFLSAYPPIQGYPHIFVLESDGSLLHSQNTGELESGGGYDAARIESFLETWSR